MFEHRFGREQRLRFLEDPQDILWCRHRLADVEGVDEIVGDLAAGQDPLLLDRHLEGDLHLGDFAVDFRLAGRARQGIRDDGPHIAKGRLPVIAERRHGNEGRIGRPGHVVLVHRCRQKASPARAFDSSRRLMIAWPRASVISPWL
ncbi:hypothetical protein [Novosphingobium panipatense]|uniref:hypothetical protein n=1 Tax=Novosphingobium panipatense TaxID=428991 RepID=UPI003623A73F